jgi:YidC/Oxa1 family membrane protein insertase
MITGLRNFFFGILDFLHANLHISWPWAIVLLTVIIRVVLIPLTWRQIKSMRAMQALQPHIKLLQEKYKDDKQVLNQKVMEFYRENKVSPFGSCLPLLLQMPVFLGLFYMLRHQGSVNAYFDAGVFSTVWHAEPVSWLWISDITQFDLLLLVAYIASQLGSSWQMGRKSAGQQRTIALIMPVVIGFVSFLYKWPAGLMLYWVTTNVWSIAQQFVAEKVMPIPVAAAAILEKDKAKASRAKGGVKPGVGAGTRTPAPRKSPTQEGKPSAAQAAEKSGGKSGASRKGQKG